MTSLSQKVSTDVLVSAILNLSTRIRGIILLPVITTTFGVDIYGVYMQLLAITTLGRLFSSFSLISGFVNFAQDSQINSGPLYYAILTVLTISAGAMGTLLFVSAETISRLTLSSNQYESVFKIGAALIPLMIMGQLGQGHYRAQMRIKTSAFLRALRDYARVAAILSVVYFFQQSIDVLVGAVVLVELVFVFCLQTVVVFDIGLQRPTFANIPSVFEYSGWLTLSNFASQLSSRADRLLIGFFIGAGAVGTYSIAYGLGSLLLIFVAPMRNTFFPEFSRLISENKSETVGKYTSLAIYYFLMLGVPGAVGLLFVSEPLLLYFTSPVEAQHAAKIVPIIGVGILFYGLDELQGVSLVAAKFTQQIALLRGGAAAINVILNAVLIPVFAISGAAVATVISYAVGSLGVQILLRRRFSFQIYWRGLGIVGVATVGMAIGLFVIPTAHIIITVFTGVVIYITLILMSGGVKIHQVREFLT